MSEPPVLMYHSVAPYDQDPYLVTVRPARFEQQLRWLHRRGLRGTSVCELLAARRDGADRGLVGLTFDDGYADFCEYVLPALARFGFTATVFVLADLLGGANIWDEAGPRKALMTAEEIRHAAERGMEIGSHGRRHVSLTSTGNGERTAEVSGSRAILQEVSGQEVTGFCYPYGQVNELAVNAVRAAGYHYGCAIWRSQLTGLHALPRTYIGDRDGSLRLLAKWYRHQLRW
ncbi:MAG: polysaccharide deacetylase family protein [Pseudonocardiales bacterium]|nr:polysaccharide deacetylase family protein [Pseudonocardiales bacterium]MBV9730917.1 polysaccharide deacetylase family protein [Pseudonocardiales bacterium]